MDSGATPPRLDPSLSKYSSNVPVQFIRIFGKNKFASNINLIAAAFSQSTWRSLEAAWNCFISFSVLKGFPSESIDQLAASQFINFMLREKKLKHSTAESYLSSLSTIFKFKRCRLFLPSQLPLKNSSERWKNSGFSGRYSGTFQKSFLLGPSPTNRPRNRHC